MPAKRTRPAQTAESRADQLAAEIQRLLKVMSPDRLDRIEGSIERLAEETRRNAEETRRALEENYRFQQTVRGAITTQQEQIGDNARQIEALRETVTQVVREWHAYIRTLPKQ